jgi:hypothetical protein
VGVGDDEVANGADGDGDADWNAGGLDARGGAGGGCGQEPEESIASS